MNIMIFILFISEIQVKALVLKYTDNKELMIIPDAVHTDLYDGGDKDYIPFDKLENFFKENVKPIEKK